jgi:intracellular septation protein
MRFAVGKSNVNRPWLLMKLFFDFLPIVLFFITYKFYGIYAATLIAIIISGVQFLLTFWLKKRIDPMQGTTFLILLLLGGTTLLLHQEIFIKWKLTVTDWLLATAFLISHLINKPLIATLMQKNIDLPMKIWKQLNLSWIIFWFFMGCLNLYVIYHFDTSTWVDFKLFGGIGLTTLFIILQAIYINRHARQPCK